MAVLHRASISASCRDHYAPGQLEAWIRLITPDAYDSALREKELFVAEGGERLLGLGMLDLEGAEVCALYVDPRGQGRGVGCGLLDAMEALASQRGLRELRLKATLNACAFYARLGYREQGEESHVLPCGTSLPCVLMVKALAAPRSGLD